MMINHRPLVAGSGSVRLAFRLRIDGVPAAMSLGMAPSLFDTVAVALHSRNRRADPTDFAAIGFPQYDATKLGANVLGSSAELFGSESALAEVLADARLRTLVSRQVATALKPRAMRAEFTNRVAFIRHRRDEKHSLGALKRMRSRSERNGLDTEKIDEKIWRLKQRIQNGERRLATPRTPDLAFVHVAGQRIWIEPTVEQSVPVAASSVVSTYGLSGRVSPLYLPLQVTLKTANSVSEKYELAPPGLSL